MKESGGNGRDSDLKQIDNAFKDPEDDFARKTTQRASVYELQARKFSLE